MGIVDDLLARPGLYVGPETAVDADRVATARIRVTPLPGGAGVSLDYEVLDLGGDDPAVGHVEHTMVGRADDGSTLMVVAHSHGTGLAVLRETDAGVFEQDAPAPYPIKIVVSVPAPGRLRHAWWHGSPDDPLIERDVAELHHVSD